MRLNADDCWDRLAGSSHGVLATVHAGRGVDPVPVVFVVVDRSIVVPVDTVKAKSTTRLQRLANLDADARCAVLVDHYEEDWSRLWWVRAHGTATVGEPTAHHLDVLGGRFPAYRRPGAVAATIVIAVSEIRGWAED